MFETLLSLIDKSTSENWPAVFRKIREWANKGIYIDDELTTEQFESMKAELISLVGA